MFVIKRKWRNDKVKKFLGIFVIGVLIIGAAGYKVIPLLYEKATAEEYYVQIQGNEDKQQHPTTDEYKLNAFNKDGEKTKIVFSVFDNETPTPLLLRVNVLKSTDSEGNHFVKNYEKVKEAELPEKVKEKIKED
ncbi:YxeA family protein [Lysinibacillus xylanilyticus]|uniref:YxeA family protein n=1 Tax=Lysinibacillus xylanilyticus TaxID=582475 RepID=UPI0036D8A419